MNEVTTALLPHQAEVLEDTWSKKLGCVGGWGSGKTNVVVKKALKLGTENPDETIAIYEPTYPMVRDILIPTIREQFTDWNLWDFVRWNKRDNEIEVEMNGARFRLLLRNTHDPLRLAGINVAAALLDEADQHKEDAVKQILPRIRRGKVRQFVAVGTPEEGGWMQDWFELEADSATRLIRARTQDNHFLPDGFIEEQIGHLSELEQKRYLEGAFVTLKGRVYSQFEKNKHIQKCRDPQRGEHVMFCDFNVGCMAWGFGVVQGKTLWVTGEQVVEGIDTINAVEMLKTRLPDHYSQIWGRHVTPEEAIRATTVYTDPQAQHKSAYKTRSDVRILRDAGFNVLFRKKHPAISDRVNSVQMKLHRGELFFDRERAPYITKCIQTQGYDAYTKPEKGKIDDGKKALDHGADALGYIIEYEWPCLRGGANQLSYN